MFGHSPVNTLSRIMAARRSAPNYLSGYNGEDRRNYKVQWRQFLHRAENNNVNITSNISYTIK